MLAYNYFFSGCGSTDIIVRNPQLELQSPNHPGLYPNDADCSNVVILGKTERIRLEFKRFDIEGSIKGCETDWLEIRDGPNITSVFLYQQKLCGKEVPAPAMSTNNEIFVRFKTDGYRQSLGYQIKLHAGKR